MAAHATLTRAAVVRVHHPVPFMLPWTNWSSRRPFKAESTGSSPVGSTKHDPAAKWQVRRLQPVERPFDPGRDLYMGAYPSGQREQTVNLPPYGFDGSNPSAPTIYSLGRNG